MISRFSKNDGFETYTKDDGSTANRTAHETYLSERYSPRWVTMPSPTDSTGRKVVRLLFLCLSVICAFAVVSTLMRQFREIGTLEKKLATERVNRAAGDLNAIIAARSSALKMSAAGLELENLSSPGELNKILTNLKDLFPDFLSIEIRDEQGRSLAMMGDLSLSQVGEQRKAQAGEKSEIDQAGQSVLFQDKPAEGIFLITLQHTGTDGKAWFSRSKFSRAPINVALTSQTGDPVLRLSSTADTSAQGVTQGTTFLEYAQQPQTITASAPLTALGWMVSAQTKVPASFQRSFAPCMFGFAALLCIVIGLRSSPKSRQEDRWTDTYTEPVTRRVFDSDAPLVGASEISALRADENTTDEGIVDDRLNEPLVPVQPLPNVRQFDHPADAIEAESLYSSSDEEDPYSRYEDDYTSEEENVFHMYSEDAPKMLQPDPKIITEISTEYEHYELVDSDPFLPDQMTDSRSHEAHLAESSADEKLYGVATGGEDKPKKVLFDSKYYAQPLEDYQVQHNAAIQRELENEFASWEAKFPKDWDPPLNITVSTHTSEIELTEKLMDSGFDLDSTAVLDDSLPDNLEITWFEPTPKLEKEPGKEGKKAERDQTASVRFTGFGNFPL